MTKGSKELKRWAVFKGDQIWEDVTPQQSSARICVMENGLEDVYPQLTKAEQESYAQLIVKAVNSHDKLVATLTKANGYLNNLLAISSTLTLGEKSYGYLADLVGEIEATLSEEGKG